MTIRELRTGSVFKLIFLSALSSFLVLALVFGVMAAFGANTVRMNGQPVHGFTAIPTSMLTALFISLVFSGMTILGFLLLRVLRPTLSVRTRNESTEAV